jgi:hypothetical protein
VLSNPADQELLLEAEQLVLNGIPIARVVERMYR